MSGGLDSGDTARVFAIAVGPSGPPRVVATYALTGVTKGGPAERGGIKAGDIIVEFGESKIGNLEDFDSALRKYKAGDKVPVVVKRGAERVKLEITLDPPK